MTGRETNLTIAIQAGGVSRRMGQDKALLPFHGKALVEWVLDGARQAGDEVILITNQRKSYQFLGIPIYPDAWSSGGALVGLYTALLRASYPLVGILACDMPFASPELMLFEKDLLQTNTEIDVAIPRRGNGIEPFHAVYRQVTCLPLIETALKNGEIRVVDWLARARVRFIDPAETLRFDPNQIAFDNLNTPEDFRQAERRFVSQAVKKG